MGTRGPLAKKNKIRRNKPDVPLKIGQSIPCEPPAESKKWHLTAKRIYRSLKKSGQAAFYEASDWAYAQYVMEQMSHALDTAEDKPLRAGQLQEINRMLSALMVTEPDRRRARIELQHPSQAPESDNLATITELTDYTALYGSGG